MVIAENVNFIMLIIVIASFIIAIVISFLIVRSIVAPITRLKNAVVEIGKGKLDTRVAIKSKDEIGYLAEAFNQMTEDLQRKIVAMEEQQWLTENIASIYDTVQGIRDLKQLSTLMISKLAHLVEAKYGAFYVKQTNEKGEILLKLYGGYALGDPKGLPEYFKLGQGSVGQCALSKETMILDVPSDYIKIVSGLGESSPTFVVISPILFEKEIAGVIELAGFDKITPIQQELIDKISVNLGIIINNILG